MKKFKNVLLSVLAIEILSVVVSFFIKITRQATFLLDSFVIIGSIFFVLSVLFSLIWFVLTLVEKRS